MNGRIHLKNMAFYGYHGHHPGETAQGQKFLVDLVLTVDIGPAAASDRLPDTVDYSRVHDICRKIVEKERVKLLETLCQRIMDAIMLKFERVSKIEIIIKKPGAPIRGVLDYVAVEASLERRRRLSRPRK
jgi:dihydroneopterin aldolase